LKGNLCHQNTDNGRVLNQKTFVTLKATAQFFSDDVNDQLAPEVELKASNILQWKVVSGREYIHYRVEWLRSG
jgi:hypothetical protein